MSTHSICFSGEIRKIFTLYPLLSRPMHTFLNSLIVLKPLSCGINSDAMPASNFQPISFFDPGCWFKFTSEAN